MVKLKQLITELESELDSVRDRMSKAGHIRNSYKQAIFRLVISNYEEVLLTLKRIYSSAAQTRQLAEAYETWSERTEHTGRITDPDMIQNFNEQMVIRQLIVLDIKVLYEWTYHIYKIFSKARIAIVLDELERMSVLRAKLITHLSEQPIVRNVKHVGAGMKWDKDFEKISIMFYSVIGPSRGRHRTIKRLVKKFGQYIPELKTESNYFEQLSIIYRKMSALTDVSLKNQAKAIVAHVGTITDPPYAIAAVLLKALRDYRKLKRL